MDVPILRSSSRRLAGVRADLLRGVRDARDATDSGRTSRRLAPRLSRSGTSSTIRGSTAWSPRAGAGSWAGTSLDERSTISGLGPISVDPAVQDHKVGRALMAAVLDRAVERRAPGVRAHPDRVPQPVAQPLREARLPHVRALFAAMHGEPAHFAEMATPVRAKWPPCFGVLATSSEAAPAADAGRRAHPLILTPSRCGCGCVTG